MNEEAKIVIEDIIKIAVIGGKSVGRSAIIRRYVFNIFTGHYLPTIGLDITSSQLDENQASKLGNEAWIHFKNIAYPEIRGKHLQNFLKGIQGVIMVFDCTDLRSVHAVDEWRLVIEQYLPILSEGKRGTRNNKQGRPIPMILLANKCDTGKSVVKPNDLDVYIKKCGYKSWHFTSARSGQSVHEAIDSLIEIVVDQVAYEKLEEKCNRKLEREHKRRLSANLSFTTQNLYEGSPEKKNSRSDSPSYMAELDSPILMGELEISSSRSSSPNRSEPDFETEQFSLRDLESKGNNFYIDLGIKLSQYKLIADQKRVSDIDLLETQRLEEYNEFKRKFLDVANCVVHFSPSNSFGDYYHDSEHESNFDGMIDLKESQTARLFSAINVFLVNSMRKWKQVLDQLETEVSLKQSVDSLSPDIKLGKSMRRTPPMGESFLRPRGEPVYQIPSRPLRRASHSEAHLNDEGEVQAETRHRSLGFGFRNARVGKNIDSNKS